MAERIAQEGEGPFGGGEGGEEIEEVGVDGFGDSLAPRAGANVEETGAGGVSVLHGVDAGEVEVEVIVWEKDFAKGAEVMRFVLFEPEDFGSGVAWQDGVSFFFEQIFRTAEGAVKFFAFSEGGGVAPEFGGADDAIICVEWDEAVLLSADTDGADFVFAGPELGDDFLNGFVGSGDPFGGVLFEVAFWEALDEGVSLGGGCEEFA